MTNLQRLEDVLRQRGHRVHLQPSEEAAYDNALSVAGAGAMMSMAILNSFEDEPSFLLDYQPGAWSKVAFDSTVHAVDAWCRSSHGQHTVGFGPSMETRVFDQGWPYRRS